MKRYPILNAQELEFCKRVAGGETAYKVCMALGSKSKGAATFRTTQLMKKPQIKAAIERIQNEALAAAGKKQGEFQAVDRSFLDAELRKRIQNSTNDRAAIAGIELGYKLLGLLIERSADLTREFANRSQEELNYFAIHGYFADAVRPESSSPARDTGAGKKDDDGGSTVQ